MSDTLTATQLRVLRKIANGFKVIRRGTTLTSNPRLALKATNGSERTVPYGTIKKFVLAGFLNDRYKITEAGRTHLTERQ